jgi:hypothetical protein
MLHFLTTAHDLLCIDMWLLWNLKVLACQLVIQNDDLEGMGQFYLKKNVNIASS